LANLEDEFPFASFYLKNKNQISYLSGLEAIVSFKNIAMRNLSLQIDRDIATDMKISAFIKKHPKEGENFREFEKALSKVSKLATAYDCKALPAIEIDENSELLYILPCKLSEGGGLYILAAFQSLAKIQNICLESMLQNENIRIKYPHLRYFELLEVPIQSATTENLLMSGNFHATLEKIVEETSYPDPDFVGKPIAQLLYRVCPGT